LAECEPPVRYEWLAVAPVAVAPSSNSHLYEMPPDLPML
jgi:hypothetical protein